MTPAQVAEPRAPRASIFGAGVPLLAVGLLAAVALLAAVHLTQGTTAIGVGDIVGWLGGDVSSAAVIVDGRIPRLAAAIVVGLALGAAGYAMQSLVRNPLASPDTLAVNGGAAAALGLTAAFGISLPGIGGAAIAFVGGIVAATAVVAIGSGRGSTTRMILVGTALALALQSATTVFILVNEQATAGLYAWGVGQLSQNGLGTLSQVVWPMLAAFGILLVLAHRLDVLALGEETAALMGVRVRPLRFATLAAAVLLSAAAVALTGPIGFVGLAAPVAIRLASSRVRGLHRHIVALPIAALAGALLVVGSDVLLRLVLGGFGALDVPTGVVTSIIGAIFIIVLARTLPAADQSEPMAGLGERPLVRRWWIVLGVAAIVLVAVALASVLVGDRMLLLGDVANWVQGVAGRAVSVTLDTRAPRILVAVLAGCALALAGSLVQTVARNPLADPYLLGVANGAGFGAVLAITVLPFGGAWVTAGSAFGGAIVAALIVIGVTTMARLGTLRLVLVGIGVGAAFGALTSMLIVSTDPWNQAKAITWLAGSTYGRGFEDALPVAIALAVTATCGWLMRRDLDLVQLDEDAPRLLGVRLSRVQLLSLSIAVVLTGTAVAAVGVVAFVGLIAPHAARSLVGSSHRAFVPVAVMLGGILVTVADLIGRTVIAPAQLPAGVMTALVGIPYFIVLLLRAGRPVAQR